MICDWPPGGGGGPVLCLGCCHPSPTPPAPFILEDSSAAECVSCEGKWQEFKRQETAHNEKRWENKKQCYHTGTRDYIYSGILCEVRKRLNPKVISWNYKHYYISAIRVTIQVRQSMYCTFNLESLENLLQNNAHCQQEKKPNKTNKQTKKPKCILKRDILLL